MTNALWKAGAESRMTWRSPAKACSRWPRSSRSAQGTASANRAHCRSWCQATGLHRMGETLNVRRLLWLLGLAVVCGCSEEHLPPGDNVFYLLTGLSVERAVPSQYSEGGVSRLLVVCECRYAGRGYMLVTAHNGGQEIGTMVSPVSGALGSQSFPVDLVAGRTEMPIEILMAPNSPHVGLGVQVLCDSVLIDNHMEYWESSPALAAYAQEFEPNTIGTFNSSYVHITMDRAPTAQ